MNRLETALIAGLAIGSGDPTDVYEIVEVAERLIGAGIVAYMHEVKIEDEEGAIALGQLIGEDLETLEATTPAEDWPALVAVFTRAGLY